MAENKKELMEEIRRLAKEKDAVILAHYYVNADVQDVADYVGDSYALARKAKEDPRKTIVFCGVTFMGESACILNPDKTVLIPAPTAVCPMALMVDEKKIEEMRQKYEDLAVVCYINSTAEIKSLSDICVTSSNALKIVRGLPNRNIFFIPDGNLGRYVKEQIPEKNVILNEGFCHVHTSITAEAIERAAHECSDAKVIAHPECVKEVCDLADYIGSTKELIDFVRTDDSSEYIVCTESGVLHEMQKVAPSKKFHFVGAKQVCPNMKKITLENVRDALINGEPKAECTEELRKKSTIPLDRMLEAAK